MFSEKLVEPLSDAFPAGEEGLHSVALQQLTVLTDFLGAKLEVQELERNARREFDGENAKSDEVAANASLEDGRRKLARFESATKELMGGTARVELVRSEVARRAEQFLVETGKDLRVVQHLALAWLMERGIDGLKDALHLMCGLLDRYGADLHPRPDEDDPTDLSARELVVSEVLNGDAFVAALRETTLLEAPGVARYSGRDAEVLDGRWEPDGPSGVRGPEDIRRMAEALAQSSGSEPASVLAAASSEIDQCADVAAQLLKRLGSGSGNSDRVLKLLQRCRVHLSAAAKEFVAQAAATRQVPAADGDTPAATHVEAAERRGGFQFATLRSREDARRQILEISRFLEATEPSHPAPLFLRRAERLLGAKDFFAIMRDMAPDSVTDLQRITGFSENSSETP